MDPWSAVAVLLLGAVLGAAGARLGGVLRRNSAPEHLTSAGPSGSSASNGGRGGADRAGPAPRGSSATDSPAGVGDAADVPGLRLVVDALEWPAVVVAGTGRVVLANAAAGDVDLVRGRRLAVPGLDEAVDRARATGRTARADVEVRGGRYRTQILAVHAVAVPLPTGDVLVQLEDRTEALRADEARRDFVVNVSHELKTPVGALSLLAEAVEAAADDPPTVTRFAVRMQREADRLARLVAEIIQLSRLQGAEPLPPAETVDLDHVVADAVDRVHPAAAARGIVVDVGGDHGVAVPGHADQLRTAVGNLLENAVAYSGDGTRVAVGIHRRPGRVEVTVADEGIGIPPADLDRIFERFYRVDAARSRATGGTGLGLSIVKHVVGNHGGRVQVWSRPGAGSTFTVSLPVPAAAGADPDAPGPVDDVDARPQFSRGADPAPPTRPAEAGS